LAQVSLEASLNSAAARLHVAKHRPDIGGAFRYDGLLLGHREGC
jgi:hypothetical protein